MKTTIVTLFRGSLLAASIEANDLCQARFDVVKPRVSDRLCRVTLNDRELGGEIDHRIQNLIYQNHMVVDLDGKWLNHFRNRTDRGNRSHVYYGVGKVFDTGSHICDATALKLQAYTNVQHATDPVDVTEKVKEKFHNRLVTPLGPYAELFGDVSPGEEKTLKIKLHYWRDDVVRYLELLQDSALDLAGK